MNHKFIIIKRQSVGDKLSYGSFDLPKMLQLKVPKVH